MQLQHTRYWFPYYQHARIHAYIHTYITCTISCLISSLRGREETGCVTLSDEVIVILEGDGEAHFIPAHPVNLYECMNVCMYVLVCKLVKMTSSVCIHSTVDVCAYVCLHTQYSRCMYEYI